MKSKEYFINNLIGRCLKPFYGGFGHILMFHRVLPDANKPSAFGSSTLEITPSYLEKIILSLQSRGLKFISMDEVFTCLHTRETKHPVAAITFDDGYVDNYYHAWPLLKKNNIPFTIYLTTDFPDGNAILWWYLLEDLIRSEGLWADPVSSNPQTYDLKNPEDKRRVSLIIRKSMKEAGKEERDGLCRRFFPGQDLFARTRALALNWTQIAEMSQDPLVTFGGHSISHAALPRLSDSESRAEITGCKEIIEKQIGKVVKHFAYPFGGPNAFGLREVEYVRDAGYLTAVSTYFANVFPEHRDHFYSLPRLDLPLMKNINEINLALDGYFPARYHHLKRIITL